MPYVPHTEEDERIMLEAIGEKSIDDLFARIIPETLQFKENLNLPPALSEFEGQKHLSNLARKNANLDEYVSFLGAGAYDHYMPSVIDHVIRRSEFATAYTPYQPEVSQGTLQAIYEYQSLICELTRMDVSNASMYDGASAVAEAVLMTWNVSTKRNKVLVSSALNPNYFKVLNTYNLGVKMQLTSIPWADEGTTDLDNLESSIGDNTAVVVVQSPNFLGNIEDVAKIAELTHKAGALLVVATDPISLGMLEPPGEQGADVVAGEGQSLGNTLSFGGPYLGFFACKMDFVRKLPGRLIGETVDAKDRRGFVMTLQTREQHIRREKATSNICTNEALNALAATVYLSTLGKQGIREVALLCAQKAHYAFDEIVKLTGYKPAFTGSFFKEFVIKTPILPASIVDQLEEKKVLAGVDLSQFDLNLDNCLLIAVTEKRTKEEIDHLVELLGNVKIS